MRVEMAEVHAGFKRIAAPVRHDPSIEDVNFSHRPLTKSVLGKGLGKQAFITDLDVPDPVAKTARAL